MAEVREPGDDAELQALRARAYGASADIRDDPDAVRRLADLERRARPSDAGVPTVDSDDQPLEAPDGTEAAAPPIPGPGPAPAEPGASTAAPARGRRPRRSFLLVWLASILATAVLAVGATLLVVDTTRAGEERASDGAHRIALLDVDPGFVPAASILGGDTRGFVPFEGMTAISTTAGLGADDGVPCLLVIATDDYDPSAGTIEGTIYSGCRAKEFPASAQFVINAASPEPLQERFGVGRGIRFVLEDGRVGVYVVG